MSLFNHIPGEDLDYQVNDPVYFEQPDHAPFSFGTVVRVDHPTQRFTPTRYVVLALDGTSHRRTCSELRPVNEMTHQWLAGVAHRAYYRRYDESYPGLEAQGEPTHIVKTYQAISL